MAYVGNKDQIAPRFGYKWSDLRNDVSDFIKLFIICFIVCCFCVFIFIFNIFVFIVTQIYTLISNLIGTCLKYQSVNKFHSS